MMMVLVVAVMMMMMMNSFLSTQHSMLQKACKQENDVTL